MSKTILAKVNGFTPLIDKIVQDHGIMTAAVFGRIWRYCQMPDGVCSASQGRMANELGISAVTINQHIRLLVQSGYLVDKTPDRLGMPHVYADTGKANLLINLIATDEPIKDFNTPYKETLPPPIKNVISKIEVRNEKETNMVDPEFSYWDQVLDVLYSDKGILRDYKRRISRGVPVRFAGGILYIAHDEPVWAQALFGRTVSNLFAGISGLAGGEIQFMEKGVTIEDGSIQN